MRWTPLKLTLLLSCLGLQTFCPTVLAMDPPRLFLWGMGGSEAIGRVDALLPLVSNQCNQLFYGDVQGQIGSDSARYYGVGLGYRMIRNPELFGAYVFYDLNYSREHTLYPVVSPGIEFSRCQWDTRLNGYFPVSRHRKREATFLDVSDSCGSNLNTDQIVFSGHQEFVPRFANIEEVGPGGDFEIGRHFPCAHNLSLYAGAYYYRFRDFDSMKGGEARVVLPIKPAIALTVEASYDNQQHAAAIGGIRIQLGHTSRCPVLTLQDRLYEPVFRNLGNVKSGAGIPIVKGVKNEGLFLFRDNIFFFTAAGGTVFDNTLATGTFQNPLRADQFTQTNVNGIAGLAPNANLFFNTGTYIVNPTSASAPNAFLTLPVGQSMYGRTADYRESAVGTQRPTFLGGLNLTGDNTLNSIILTNSMTGSGVSSISLNTMDIESAANIFICNSDINAILEITGDNIAIQSVSALYANASEVTISNSNINASTTIMGAGESNGDSLVTCIGGNSVAGSSKNSALNIFNISK